MNMAFQTPIKAQAKVPFSYVYVCLPAWMNAHHESVTRGQKGGSDTLRLEPQTVMTYHMDGRD